MSNLFFSTPEKLIKLSYTIDWMIPSFSPVTCGTTFESYTEPVFAVCGLFVDVTVYTIPLLLCEIPVIWIIAAI